MPVLPTEPKIAGTAWDCLRLPRLRNLLMVDNPVTQLTCWACCYTICYTISECIQCIPCILVSDACWFSVSCCGRKRRCQEALDEQWGGCAEGVLVLSPEARCLRVSIPCEYPQNYKPQGPAELPRAGETSLSSIPLSGDHQTLSMSLPVSPLLKSTCTIICECFFFLKNKKRGWILKA